MRSSAVLWALVALNVLLFVTFVGKFTHGNAAIAQGTRRPGEFAMIAGEVTGASGGVVYMLDTTNGILTAVTFDQSANPPKMVSLPKIDLAAIFQKGAEPAKPGGRK